MKRRAKFSDVVKYSFGGIGSNLPFLLIMSYMTFFYTDVFGISTAAAAGLMFVARIIDVITDPIMGILIDRTHSKMGRFRPYIIYGAPVLGLVIFMLFTTPSFSPGAKVVYAYVAYIGYSIASTVVNIPYHSLTAIMSEDTDQRTVIVSWKQGMSIFPQFLIALSFPVVTFFGGSTTSTLGWSVYGAIVGIVTTIVFWICAWGGKPYDTMDKYYTKVEKKKDKNILKEVGLLLKNKPLILLLIAFGTDLFAAALSNAVFIYYYKYVLHQEGWVAITSLASLIASTLAIFTIAPLAKKFGKKNLNIWISIICIIPNIVLMFAPNLTLALLTAMTSVYCFTVQITSTLGWAMLPDCVDWGEWKFNVRTDGLTTSTMTFMNKLCSAIAASGALLVLDAIGFVPGQEQTQLVRNAIVFLMLGAPILGHVATVISMYFYELTKTRVNEIHQELAMRHEKNNE